jgi:hypothetical protein
MVGLHMRRGTFAVLALGAALLLRSAPALAWGNTGHMEVAALAWNLLSSSEQAAVGKLLVHNPLYSTWTKGAAKKDKPRIAFIMAATWPDIIKHTSGYVDDGLQPGGEHPDPNNKAEAGQNIGYGDKNRHRYWHFVDVAYLTQGEKGHAPDFVNAQTQIALLTKTLADKSKLADLRSYDLVWLEHLVGDLHQPLHCASRYDKEQPEGDEGGNKVSLCVNCKSELHGLWDDFPGATDITADEAMTKAQQLPKPSNQQAGDLNVQTWIDESFALAKSDVYRDPPIKVGKGPYTVDAAYTTNGQKISDQRISLAGARLAGVIKQALAGQ